MAYTDIDKSDDYFNTVLYTGDGSSNRIISSGFATDFVWCKSRSVAGGQHFLSDSVRGDGKLLQSESTAAEFTAVGNGIHTNGAIWGNGLGVNGNGETYVNWFWKAGGTAVSNTQGSITSSVSANQTAGFSIATFTAPSAGTVFDVGHGLGGKPDMMITKAIDGTSAWWVWHIGLGDNTTDFLSLNTTNAESSVSGMWGTVGAGTSTFGYTAGTSAYIDIDNVAYFFKSIKGFSKFGSYTGNGSTDGTFVYTGFKPAYFMIKRTDSTGSWIIHDNKRSIYNVTSHDLYANLNNAEVTGNRFDFVSNGVKLRNNPTNMNASGGTYIYMAFAENPFTTSTGIPTTGR